jgi:hypothetical protein
MLFNFTTPVLIRYLCQLKTVVFLHWRLINTFLLTLSTNDIQHNTTLRYAECNNYLNVMPSVLMLNAIVLSVVMLIVVAPSIYYIDKVAATLAVID